MPTFSGKIISFRKSNKTFAFLFLFTVGVITFASRNSLKMLINSTPPVLQPAYSWEELLRNHAELSGDWFVDKSMLALPPGGYGQLILKANKKVGEGIIVRLRLSSDKYLSNKLEVSNDGKNYRLLFTNSSFFNNPIDLTSYVERSDCVWLKLFASYQYFNNQDLGIVLENIEIQPIENPLHLPNLPALFLLILIPVLFYFLGRLVFARERIATFLALFILMLEVASQYYFPEIANSKLFFRSTWATFILNVLNNWKVDAYLLRWPLDFPLFAYFIALIIYCLFLWFRKNNFSNRHYWGIFFLLLLVAWGFNLRWEVLQENKYDSLDGDVFAFRELALNMKYPYDTGPREPLWICMIKMWSMVFGSNDVNIKILTVLLSLIGIIVCYKFIHDYTGKESLALITSYLLSTNSYLGWFCTRGFRLELYIILIMCFSYFIFIPPAKLSNRARLLGLSLAGALTTLLQINSIIFIIPALVYSFGKYSIEWKKILIPLISILLLILPYLAYCEIKYGDYFISNNLHAVFYRNHEFVNKKQVGCEGCPTPQEYSQSKYSGKQITSFRYIFGMHTLREIVENTLKGYYGIFLKKSQLLDKQTGKGTSIPYYLYLVGLIVLALSSYRELLLMPIFSINFLAFIVPMGIDPRLVEHAAPFSSLALAFGIWAPLALAYKGYVILTAEKIQPSESI